MQLVVVSSKKDFLLFLLKCGHWNTVLNCRNCSRNMYLTPDFKFHDLCIVCCVLVDIFYQGKEIPEELV